jgi:hypothetical protein
MMINSSSDSQQDTVPVKISVLQDTIGLKTDSASLINISQQKDSVPHKSSVTHGPIQFIFADTTTVCCRNSIADVTFYDSNNVIFKPEPASSRLFPFNFTAKNKQMHDEAKASLVRQLKPGLDIPRQPFHDDLIIIIILIAALLYTIVRKTSINLLLVVSRFFLFRGINDPSSRDAGGLFNWQSTILNLISFLIIGLFYYAAADYFDFIPFATRGITFWFTSLGIIIIAVTLQHMVSMITGIISGQREVFREYLYGVYQSYRFSALLFFILIILMSYTILFPAKVYFITGIVIFSVMYLLRVIRLLIIFINRNLSIFYLILYLCALEILPVLITVKYFTGLV